jgi:hypothetical protein
MKKLILLILFTVSLQAQNVYFSVGLDIKNITVGSKPTNNNSELDLMAKFGMVSNKKVEATLNYERFKRLDFWKFGFGLGKQILIAEKIMIVPTLEYNLINRSDDWGGGLGYKDNPSSHLAFGASVPIRYNIDDNWAVELQINLLQRTDIKAKYGKDKWVLSNFLNLIYKINL